MARSDDSDQRGRQVCATAEKGRMKLEERRREKSKEGEKEKVGETEIRKAEMGHKRKTEKIFLHKNAANDS